jgi:DNA-binding transcriptional LysR family regulator
MIERIRALLAVMEEGGVNRAASRLRLSQPALSRQIQALETEIGGKLLERGPAGVSPTSLGHALAEAMRPVVASYDAALENARRRARGYAAEFRESRCSPRTRSQSRATRSTICPS